MIANDDRRKWHLLFLCILVPLLLLACRPNDPKSGKSSDAIRQTAPYGSWSSPLGASQVYGAADEIGELQAVGDAIYFSQANGNASGSVSINRLEAVDPTADFPSRGTQQMRVVETVPAQFDVASRVHEYGGAPFLGIGQSLFVTKKSDQRFYRIASNQEPLALTPQGTRHADCVSYPKGSRIICVREDHRGEGEPKASLVTINLNFPGEGDTLVSGHDFISSPTLSPDNRHLAWLTWEHPDMPWDETVLWMGDLNRKGELHRVRRVAVDRRGAISQPQFSPSGQLYFVADFDNWWNIYRLSAEGKAELVHRQDADFAVPDWRLGNHNYAFEADDTLIASFIQNGEAALLRISLSSGITEELAVDFGEISQVVKGSDAIYFVGAKQTPEKGIYRVTGRGVELVYAPALPALDPNYISRASSIHFVTGDDETAWGYFYAPRNPRFRPVDDTRPPLLVMLHSGPTLKASLAYRSDIQFWTSRGFAVLDLNFRGSSGFGRAYRQRLYGQWGKIDVEDAINAARYLAAKGWVDGSQMAIRGGSAGSLTVFSALAFFDTFRAGVVYSAISDFETLARETHKFETGYLDHLIGPIETSREVYRARSPLLNLDGFTEPLLMLQGMEDTIVSPMQSQRIYQAIKARGTPIALVQFEGEGHGNWKPQNKAAGLMAELSFYGQVFGITPADALAPLTLENAAALRP